MTIESKLTPQEPKEPRKISRRNFLKSSVTAGIGAGLVLGGYDRISQKIREFSNTYVQEGLPNVIEKMKTLYPAIDQWAKPEEWSAVIYEQCKKNQLPLTQENLCLILAIIGAESGFRASPRVVDFWMTPSEKFVGKLGIMKSKTSGAMEITVQDIMDREKIGYNEALEEISIIQAGIGFGIEHLKKIIDIYKNISDDNLRLKCIFADYNAGLFTSRNTGVQIILNKIGNFALREDGLLFSQTEQAIKKLFLNHNISITTEQIKKDLLDRMNYEFSNSQTYQALMKLNGGNMPMKPADSPFLGFSSYIIKIFTGVGSSKEFAEHRLIEFNAIMELMLKEKQNQMKSIKNNEEEF